MKTKILVFYLSFLSISLSQTNYQWHHLNGPLGGIVGDIAIDSKDNIYAGVYTNFFYYYTGIFKSSDNGETWQDLKTDYDEIQIYSIFINKNDTIYLGTSGVGLHLSDDYGETWTRIDTGYNTREWFAIGQNQYGNFFAGDAQYQRMYKSYNNGFNWEFIGNYAPLNIDIDEQNILFASTLDSYIYSTDDGESWSTNDFFKGTAVSDILPLGNRELLLGTGYGSYVGSGIYKSYNSGKTWELKGLSDIKNILSFAKDTSNNIYAGTGYEGLFKTTNEGEDWTKVEGWKGKQVFRVKVNSKNDIFVGSEDEGVYRSTDDGESFEQIGLPISNVKAIDFSKDGNFIYTATPSGLQVFDRSNSKWYNKGFYRVQGVSVSSSGKVFVATSSEGVYSSDDNCDTWIKLPFEGVAYNIKSINDTTLLLATSGQLLLSRDEGQTWCETGITTGWTRNAISFNKKNKKIIILGENSSSRTIFLSNDYCESFSEIEIDLTPYRTNSIAIDNSETIYLASNLLNSNEYGVYRSSPPYNEWSKLLDGLSYSVHVDPENRVFAGTLFGIFQSLNNGENWQLIFDEQMPRTFPVALGTDDNSKLLIGTYSYGLFEMQLPTDINDNRELVNNYSLSQNYPNPFNPTTIINYSIPKNDFVSLKVYDSLGKLVVTLENGVKNSGKYSVSFNAENLSSGLYFYTLRTSSGSITKKMLLVR